MASKPGPRRRETQEEPAAPASASSSSPSASAGPSTTSSASAVQPVKKAGHGVASQASRSTPDASQSPPPSSTAGKRQRLYGPEPSALNRERIADVDMTSPEERKGEVDVAPSAPAPAAAAAAPAPSVVATAVTVTVTPVTSESTSSSSSSSAPPQSPTLSDSAAAADVPVWVDTDKLLKAGLDPRVWTDFVVNLEVDKRAGQKLLVRKVPKEQRTPQSTLLTAAELLGDVESGLCIVAPSLPSAIVLAADAGASVRSAWSPEQLAWYDSLVAQAKANGELVRNLSVGSIEQRCRAVNTLRDHVSQDQVKQVWAEQRLTRKWADLLVTPSGVLKDALNPNMIQHKAEKSTGQGQSAGKDVSESNRNGRCEVKLCCKNDVVAYVVVCTLLAYSLIRDENKREAERFRAILNGPAPVEVASTDTDSSSDSDDGWEQQTRRQSSGTKARRSNGGRNDKLKAFLATYLKDPSWHADCNRPLLQFATHMTIRNWTNHYVECFVSNWGSVGCGDRFDASDEAYRRVVDAFPEFTAPSAGWCLRSAVGGTLVSLFVRDTLFDMLPKINARLRQQPVDALQDAALKVVCDTHPQRKKGDRRRRWNDKTRYCLTPEAATAPTRTARVPPSASPSTMPSWAAVLSAARPVASPSSRRPAPTAAPDHRPHKDQRVDQPVAAATVKSPAASVAVPAAAAPRSVAPAPSTHGKPSTLESRVTAMETELAGLRDVPRMLMSIMQRLDQQSQPTVPSVSGSPLPAAAAVSSAAVPPASSSSPSPPAISPAVAPPAPVSSLPLSAAVATTAAVSSKPAVRRRITECDRPQPDAASQLTELDQQVRGHALRMDQMAAQLSEVLGILRALQSQSLPAGYEPAGPDFGAAHAAADMSAHAMSE